MKRIPRRRVSRFLELLVDGSVQQGQSAWGSVHAKSDVKLVLVAVPGLPLMPLWNSPRTPERSRFQARR